MMPVLMSFGLLGMLHAPVVAALVQQDVLRDKRTGQWEQLVLRE